jgi:hypothetical protein
MSRWTERVLGVGLTLAVVAVLLGCGGIQKAIQEEQKKQQRTAQLEAVGTAYADYRSEHNDQSPSKAADLDKYLEATALAAVNSGEIVVIWDADYDAMGKKGKGPDAFVLAHDSAAPNAGGLVLMAADEEVKEMTAAEFNAAPKAPTRPPQKKEEKQP